MILSSLLEELVEWRCNKPTHTIVGAVTDRVAEVQPGDVFVAISGTNFDGNSVISEAITRGAAAVVRQTDTVPLPPSIVDVIVPDARLALALLLKKRMAGVAEAVAAISWIGITGTNGKTTVATLIEQMLYASGKKTAFIGTTCIGYRDNDGTMTTMETTYTTPHARRLYELALLFASKGVTHVVMEVSSHGLHQHRVAGLTFTGALFTNLTRDHLDYHGSMDAYASAKKILFDGLQKGAVAVVNANSDYASFMLRDCPAERSLLVTVDHIEATPTQTRFTIQASCKNSDTYSFNVTSPLIGEFNASNVALACVLVKEFGVGGDQINQLVEGLKPPSGRMERIRTSAGVMAVVDYAHSPDALKQALGTLRGLTAHLTVVFGCGGNRDVGKRKLMGAVASEIADEIWLTSDNPRDEDPFAIIRDIQSGVTQPLRVFVEADRTTAIKKALQNASADSIVLIAGKGHETYQEVSGVRIHFSDQEVVLAM